MPEINGGLVIYAVLAAIAVVLIGAAVVSAVSRSWTLFALAIVVLTVFAGVAWMLLHAWKA